MHISIGTDIECVSRFIHYLTINNKQLLKRIFTVQELEYCLNKNNIQARAQSLTARWCAKEACIKALNKQVLTLKNIEISHNSTNQPIIILHNNNDLSNLNIQLTLSHCNDYATATVLVVG